LSSLLSQITWVTSSHAISFKAILIFSSHVYMVLHSGFPIEVFYAFHLSPVPTTSQPSLNVWDEPISRTGFLKFFLPGTPDEVKKVWYLMQNKLKNTQPTFELPTDKKVQNAIGLVWFYGLRSQFILKWFVTQDFSELAFN
jgi:hypothetical protein